MQILRLKIKRVDTRIVKNSSACSCTNLRRAARSISELYDEFLAPSRLKATQFSLLRALDRIGSTSITTLAEEIRLDRTTLGRNLQVLGRDGYVLLEYGTDLRERTIVLTTSGKRALEKAIPLWEQAQAQIVTRLGNRKLEGLTAILSKLEALAG